MCACFDSSDDPYALWAKVVPIYFSSEPRRCFKSQRYAQFVCTWSGYLLVTVHKHTTWFGCGDIVAQSPWPVTLKTPMQSFCTTIWLKIRITICHKALQLLMTYHQSLAANGAADRKMYTVIQTVVFSFHEPSLWPWPSRQHSNLSPTRHSSLFLQKCTFHFTAKPLRMFKDISSEPIFLFLKEINIFGKI